VIYRIILQSIAQTIWENYRMNNANKMLAGLLLSMLALGAVSPQSAKAEPSNSVPSANPGKKNRAPVRLTGNRNLPMSKFLGKGHFQSRLNKELGAELKSFELITFKEYLNKYSPGTEVAEVADDRMVAIVQIYYPRRFTANNGVEYLNATSISARDGLTGEVIEYEVTGRLANPETFAKGRVVNP
jgi:hypothetical protein